MAVPLKTLLKNNLKNSNKTVVLGVGSELRGDDAAGQLLAQRLTALARKSALTRRLKVIYGATAPENFTGEIKAFKPTHVVIVDSASMKRKPGALVLITPEEIDGVTFNTHQLPLSILVSYLQKEIGCAVSVIGIQPKTLEFGAPISPEVRKSTLALAQTLINILKS